MSRSAGARNMAARLVWRALLVRRRRMGFALLALLVGATLASALLTTYADLEKKMAGEAKQVGGVPITRHWLIPQAQRPKVYTPHPVMSADEIRARTQAVWDRFYSVSRIWERSRCTHTLRARVAFLLISKLYRQMYANTGIATDSARVSKANRWARWIAKPCRRLFVAQPLPDLTVPVMEH